MSRIPRPAYRQAVPAREAWWRDLLLTARDLLALVAIVAVVTLVVWFLMALWLSGARP